MSATATYAPRMADHGRDAAPGLARLTRVELRKMYDTRAGFWLLLSGLALTLLVAALTVFTGSASEKNFRSVLDGSVQSINVLVPIVGILLVTSEWSQRTAQVTFTLVPRRGRVLVAKVLASVVLALLAFVVAFGVSALFTALGGESTAPDGVWSLDGAVLFQTIVFTIISMLGGVAFGAAILLSAPAIVASFVVPLAVSALTHIISGLDGLGEWIDPGRTYSALTNHSLSGQEWAQVGTSVLLWVGLPLAVGLYRFLRGEVR
jgi:ABC-type transport system involved in multi-copper enzyme maturation permease subunit